MTNDLESTLSELGPEYMRMIECMRAPFVDSAMKTGLWSRFRISAYLVAASFAALLAFVMVIRPSASQPSAPTEYPRCYTMALDADSSAIRELIATQRPDGGWTSDYLTRQNAAALRGVNGAEIAYRKAVRYLKMKGLSPLSPEELKSRRRLAAGLLASI